MRVRSDDAEIAYTVSGNGPDVVLLHPFPAAGAFWSALAQRLESRYRLIVPDLRGHGESGVGEGPATMAKHAADLRRVCDDAEVSRAVFAGCSIGGYILFEFWRRHSDRVAALILCDTKAGADTPEARSTRLQAAADVERGGAEPFVDSMLPKLLGATSHRNRPDVVDAARTMMLRNRPAGIAAVQRGMAERPDSTGTLKSITVPMLLIFGEEDSLTPIAEGEAMRKQIPGSRLVAIPKAGHYAPFEQPEEAGRLIREFLDGLPGR